MAPRANAGTGFAPGLAFRDRCAPGASLGLLSCFAVTDVPAAVSGAVTMLWDPRGEVLRGGGAASGAAAAAAAAGGLSLPMAKQYQHCSPAAGDAPSGGAAAASPPGPGPDLMAAFADQYAPWDFVLYPEGLRLADGPVDALLLRLPLPQRPAAQPPPATVRAGPGAGAGVGARHVLWNGGVAVAAGAAAAAAYGVSELCAALEEFQAQAARSLLFMSHVEVSERVLCSHGVAGGGGGVQRQCCRSCPRCISDAWGMFAKRRVAGLGRGGRHQCCPCVGKGFGNAIEFAHCISSA